MRLRRPGILPWHPWTAVVCPLVRHDRSTLHRVGPLRADLSMAYRTALIGIAVAGGGLGGGHEPPRAVDPHLTAGLVGLRHGERVPRGGLSLPEHGRHAE